MIEKILAVLTEIRDELKALNANRAAAPAAKVQPPVTIVPLVPAPPPPPPAAEPEDDLSGGAQRIVTQAEVIEAVRQGVADPSIGREKVKEVLKKYNAARGVNVKPEHFLAFVSDIEALKGKG